MDLIVESPVSALWGDNRYRCAIGHGGMIAVADKREGDGKTPVGRWVMREVFYRDDRVAKPVTALPVRALDSNDGWCDASDDPNYNKFVRLPYKASAEHLWRDDNLYDIIVVLGHNDSPVRPGMGSAVFLHVARPDFSCSPGCVTLRQADLLNVLRGVGKNSSVEVLQP
jgi:L,D-peptidoglycan transpeptidase YkuD (ErfK/YbiS/YcfS/YnhG family)